MYAIFLHSWRLNFQDKINLRVKKGAFLHDMAHLIQELEVGNGIHLKIYLLSFPSLQHTSKKVVKREM